ncbi:sensor domain-containing protein [Leucobacter weissii]|uniref:histidine kinase n=1 Tax=Leucobacter weissii TaxID=1983706 RepID=A0A939MK13_9MICO|nr:sensor histidine kinase [Leucobacter weissii]MBO1902399.1 sensor domain-containing protein [Leucobacter weissii]
MVTTPSTPGRNAPLWSISRIGRDYAFVLPGFFVSLLAFVLLVPLTALSLGTLVVWVGALLLPVALRLASVFAELSRTRVRSYGVDVPTPAYAATRPGLAGHLRTMIDPRRWLDLAFETLVAFPLRTFTFVTAVTWTGVAVGGITHVIWGVFLPQDDLTLAGLILEGLTAGAAPDALAHSHLLEAGFNFVAGCLFLVTLPAVLRGLARLDAATTATALGGSGLSAPAGTERGAEVPDGTGPAGSPPGRDPVRSAANEPVAPQAVVSDPAVTGDGWAWIATTAGAVVSVAVAWPLLAALYGVPVVIAMILALAPAAALLLAVRWPAAGIAVLTTAATATALATAGGSEWPWPWPVMTLIAQAMLILLLGLRRRWGWALASWLLPQAAVAATALPFGLDGGGWGSISTSSAVTGGVLVVAVVTRQLHASRGALREERRTSAELSARRHELEERNRIAQELHDVVAHSMSVISVQATTARYRLDGLDPAAETEFASIADSSRQALGEMRSLLALLRSSGDDREAPLAPRPTLDDLPALVEATRRSGARISLDVTRRRDAEGAEASAIPAATGLTAYRIVQEALSNAMRHAPGSAIGVVVTEDGERIVLDVENGPADPPDGQPVVPGAGLGLAGVRERATALGGSVESGATASGGFRVSATLPLG